MNQRIKNYTFVAASKQITLTDVTTINIDDVSAIRNITTNDWIYRVTDTSTDTITIANNVITFTASNAGMADGDDLLIQVDQSGSQLMDESVSVVPAKIEKFRTSFASAVSNNVDSEYFTLVRSGTGMTVNQTGGNLVLTSGTTARSETIIRSNESFMHSLHLKYAISMSQRIINSQVFIELVDVIGDGLTYSIGSATAVTVTIPNNPFTSANIGQSVYIGNFNGTGTFLSGRYPIVSVSGNDVTFTVSGFTVGTGTCSLFGWNYYQLQYQGVTTTLVNFDSQRNGYNSGFTSANINATNTPGHMGILTTENDSVMYLDQLTSSAFIAQVSPRASRVTGVPGEDVQLYLQIRVLNLTTAPASSTTSTLSFISVERFQSQTVSIGTIKPQLMQDALPVKVGGTVASTQSGTWSSRTQTGAGSAVTSNFAYTSGSVSLDATLPISTITPITSAAITTTTTTAAFVTNSPGISFVIPVTASSGTTPTMDVVIQESLDGTNWLNVYSFDRIITTGTYHSPLLRFRGRQIRFVQTLSGTSPSFTRSIVANQASFAPSITKSAFIRTLDLNQIITASASTGDMFDDCTNFTVYMKSTGSTGPTMAMQISPNNTDWIQVGTWSAPIGMSAVKFTDTYQGKFVRFIPTVAGTSATLDYIQVIGTN